MCCSLPAQPLCLPNGYGSSNPCGGSGIYPGAVQAVTWVVWDRSEPAGTPRSRSSWSGRGGCSRERRGQGLVREGTRGPWRVSRIGAVSAVAAVGTDELALQPEHLHAADLTVLARGLGRLGGLLLLCLLLAHDKRSIRARRAPDTREFSPSADRLSMPG